MRIAICDDNLEIILELEKYLLEFFKNMNISQVEIVKFTNGESLLKDQGAKDIVFLDVEMPGLSGIYVGKKLKIQNKNIIIFVVTSFSEYLDDAMRFRVFRYLSKPIDKLRFMRNLKDAILVYDHLIQKIAIETKDSTYIIPMSEIIMVEVLGRQVKLETTTTAYTSIKTMGYWKDVLSGNYFFQTHQSYIVNLKYVSSFDHSQVFLYNNQYSAHIARRKYTAFKENYMSYLESMR